MSRNVSIPVILIISLLSWPGTISALIGVNITPDTWNVGSGGEGTWVTRSTFTIENIGTDAVKATIRATNTQNWVLADNPGLNTFSMGWEIAPNAANISTINTPFVSSLPAGSKSAFNLRYKSPTSITPITLTDVQNSTITITIEPLPIITTTYVLKNTITAFITGPKGITTDSDGNIYVSASGDNWITKFSPSGAVIATWPIPWVAVQNLGGIKFSKDGYLYLATSNSVKKISTTGNIVLLGGVSAGGTGGLAIDDTNGLVYVANPSNNWVETLNKDSLVRTPVWHGFSEPRDVAVDPNTGDVYIGDGCNVKKYTKDHTLLKTIGACGGWSDPPNGKLIGGVGSIAVDKYGYVYIADKNWFYVHKFDSEGNYISEWKISGGYSNVSSIYVNDAGYVHLTLYNNNIAQIYEPR